MLVPWRVSVWKNKIKSPWWNWQHLQRLHFAAVGMFFFLLPIRVHASGQHWMVLCEAISHENIWEATGTNLNTLHITNISPKALLKIMLLLLKQNIMANSRQTIPKKLVDDGQGIRSWFLTFAFQTLDPTNQELLEIHPSKSDSYGKCICHKLALLHQY